MNSINKLNFILGHLDILKKQINNDFIKLVLSRSLKNNKKNFCTEKKFKVF